MSCLQITVGRYYMVRDKNFDSLFSSYLITETETETPRNV